MFFLVLTTLLGLGYAYLASSAAPDWQWRAALAVPFVVMWSIPILYWRGGRPNRKWFDSLVQHLGYLSMGWLSFFFAFTVMRDVYVAAASWLHFTAPAVLEGHSGAMLITVGSITATAVGALIAATGPRIHEVVIPISDLPQALEGFKIVQISDLHVGPTLGQRYVKRVVAKANALSPDIVAVTGDIVDGDVSRLSHDVAPLAELQPAGRVYAVLGNHEYYSGVGAWIGHFAALNMQVLLNTYTALPWCDTTVIIGGVLDPAARMHDRAAEPRPDLARGPDMAANVPVFRLLLAHNPKVTPHAERAGFDLQLSGHTHGGQFFPWTLVTWLVHMPHFVGLSRRGKMWVYVNPGTGTWGPPIRLGTRPELTLIRLARA